MWSTSWLSPRSSIQVGYRHQEVNQEFISGGMVTDVGVHTDLWVHSELSLSGFVQYKKWMFPVLLPGVQLNVTTSFQLIFWPRHWGK